MKFNNEIAYFMGGSVSKDVAGLIKVWNVPKGTPEHHTSLARMGVFHYHNDWNVLTSVIDYIETLTVEEEIFRFVFYKNTCIVEAHWTIFDSKIWHTHIQTEGKNKMEAAYKAVINMITFINKNKRNESRRKENQ
jgi:hypothetical protein